MLEFFMWPPAYEFLQIICQLLNDVFEDRSWIGIEDEGLATFTTLQIIYLHKNKNWVYHKQHILKGGKDGTFRAAVSSGLD